MKLATTIKSSTTAMTKAVSKEESRLPPTDSPGSKGGAPTYSPVFHGGVNPPTDPIAGTSLFIVEYDGSMPLNLPADWPFPNYEVRRKLPMKECHRCKGEMFYFSDSHSTLLARRVKARRTSWLFRKRGEFFWFRICFNHMKPEQRAVIKEMYSR